MLLIRPRVRANKYRVTAHHVVFFIFIVSNVGGCLTPIGDPPLFLGYLQGIEFWWVARHGWLIWLTALAILLAMFYAIDARNYARAPKRVREDSRGMSVGDSTGYPIWCSWASFLVRCSSTTRPSCARD